MSSGTLEEIWGERALLAPAFACAIGVGYLPLLRRMIAAGEVSERQPVS